MSQVTINDVRTGINIALDTAFPNIKIMGEEIKEGLNPPCFFVQLLEPAHEQELGRRYRRYHPFDVRYYDPDRSNEEMYTTAERLTDILEWITVAGQPIHGTSMRFNIVDEILHFFVDYNFMVWRPEPNVPNMQDLDLKEGLKE